MHSDTPNVMPNRLFIDLVAELANGSTSPPNEFGLLEAAAADGAVLDTLGADSVGAKIMPVEEDDTVGAGRAMDDRVVVGFEELESDVSVASAPSTDEVLEGACVVFAGCDADVAGVSETEGQSAWTPRLRKNRPMRVF